MRRVNEALYTDDELREIYGVEDTDADISKWEWFLHNYTGRIWFTATHYGLFVELDFQLLKKEYPHLVEPLLTNFEEEKAEIDFTARELLPADLYQSKQFPRLRWVNLDR